MESTDSKKLVQYFHDCFSADHREFQLSNFFATKVEKSIIDTRQEELLTRHLPFLPIDEKNAITYKGILSLYPKEKELYYCAFFLTGPSLLLNGRNVRICAPLLLYPSTLKTQREDGETYYFITPDFDRCIINKHILRSISRAVAPDRDFQEDLLLRFPTDKLEFGDLGNLIRLLNKLIPELDTSPLLLYPAKESGKQLRAKAKSRAKNLSFQIHSATGTGILSKSSEALGVHLELQELVNAGAWSLPLTSLLGSPTATATAAETPPAADPIVPTFLNNAQVNAIKNASEQTCSMIIGPPGTGKSYTIASMAADQVNRGKSILIVSKNNEAVDVIGDKIESLLQVENLVIRGGKSHYLKGLKAFLEDLLSTKPLSRDQIDQLEHQRKILGRKYLVKFDQIEALEKRFRELTELELKWGEFLSNRSKYKAVRDRLLQKFENFKDNSLMHWELIRSINARLEEQHHLLREQIKKIQQIEIALELLDNRDNLKMFLSSLRARTVHLKEQRFKRVDFEHLIRIFPVWLVNLSDLHQVLPLQHELFDLVVIDEASQCDITTCLPALHRAKRAVVCGDPKQLRHVSFLSQRFQNELQDQLNLTDVDINLDYRNQSVLDLMDQHLSSQKQLSILNEHFRSAEPIIHFSNTQFYNSGLQIMSKRPEVYWTSKAHAITATGLHFHHVKGKRLSSGVNREEIQAVLKHIRSIVQLQEDFPRKHQQSIGIISPFRAQIDAIAKELLKSFTLDELERHRIITGTAHSFQGEERDIMFVSFSIDANSHAGSRRHLEKEDVFNVSITRARNTQHILHSVKPDELPAESLLRRYLEHNPKEIPSHYSEELHDTFAKEVIQALKQKDVQIWPGFHLANMTIDLFVHYQGKFAGIDLIGHPGDFEDAFELERYKILYRSGIPVVPIPYTFWQVASEQCISAIGHVLGQ